MKNTIIASLIGAALAIIGFVALRPAQPTYADLQRAQLAAEQAQAVAPAWTIASWIFIVGFPVVLLGLTAAGGAVAIGRFRKLARPDNAGRLPVLLNHADVYQSAAVASLADYHATERQRASIAPVPHTYSPSQSQSYHYAPAPRLSYDYTSERSAEQLIDQPLLAAGIVPTVAQLLDQHQIGAGVPLLLGYDAEEGKPIPGSWLDLFSVGIGGLSGSGKTWTGMFLVAQAMLHGARVAVLDPHGGDADSFTQRCAPLSSRYICDPAQDRKTMLATVRLFADEIERRKAKGRGEPWVLIADEFSALMRGDLAEPLGLLMEAIAQEGRKLGIYGLALGQAWQVDRSGGGSMRDSLASCYIHRLRPAQARYLSGLSADSLPSDVLELQPGRAYLLSTRGDLRRVAIPQMVESDVVRIAGLLEAHAPTIERRTPATPVPHASAYRMPDVSRNEASGELASRAVGSDIPHSAEAARAAALFLGGMTYPPDLVFELRGIKSNQGTKYQAALAEVMGLVRQGMSHSAS